MLYSGKITTASTKETIAEINKIAEKTNSCIVLFDAEKIAGRQHIECALAHAKRAFSEKKNIARTLSMEILLYVSAQRQCSLAPRFGLHEGENYVYVLIEGGDEKTARTELAKLIADAPEVCATVDTLKKEFGITDAELEITGISRISELVCERVALMEIR
ncbi:MAG TPA: KEOPS complex subunit Cgi121 [Methanocorpusculum sp.]|nr:KEOPS complex subunit Cgi121 [Methanocorpusculum sp.]